jgi:hypothetical protein
MQMNAPLNMLLEGLFCYCTGMRSLTPKCLSCSHFNSSQVTFDKAGDSRTLVTARDLHARWYNFNITSSVLHTRYVVYKARIYLMLRNISERTEFRHSSTVQAKLSVAFQKSSLISFIYLFSNGLFNDGIRS